MSSLSSSTPDARLNVCHTARGIRTVDLVWTVVGIIFLWKFGPEGLLVPIGTTAGIVLAFLGVAAVVPLRKAFYSVLPHEKGGASERWHIAVAFGLACLSLCMWVPLFTFSSCWKFWADDKVATGPIAVWFINTCIFGYGFLMTRRLAAEVDEINHGLRAGQVDVVLTKPVSLSESGRSVIVVQNVDHGKSPVFAAHTRDGVRSN